MTTTIVIMRLRKFQVACLASLVLAIAALSPVSAYAQFLHPKIASKEVTVRNIVILPAKVEVVRDSMKGPEGMAAE